MCGISGILRTHNQANPIDRDELIRTRDSMSTRGPDGTGQWISPTLEIGLGHRRLAIIDLSPSGAQPMAWDNGRYHITFNGEIYNYRELRDELSRAGVVLNTHSDTEVLLALYALYGVGMFAWLRGMYAFAIWDEQTHRLMLARDPYGIKPLYYATDGKYFRFASQVKALEASGEISLETDPAGVVGFMLWGSVPEPYTIRRAVHALPAGHFMIVEQGRVGDPQAHYEWDAPVTPSFEDVQSALLETVRAHLVADVPVGVFLSGGLDSTLLAALACRILPEPLRTFSLGFDSFVGKSYDELPMANCVARKLGTCHTEKRINSADMPDLWESVLAAMDQPTIDGFNVFVVSKFAHEVGLKVVLSGLGGDEMFGSYPSFRQVPQWLMWSKRAQHVPGLNALWPPIAQRLRPSQPKLKGLLKYNADMGGMYFLRRGLYLPDELSDLIGQEMVEEGLRAYDPVEQAGKLIGNSKDNWQAIHRLESGQYMRNQLLRDADWASMAHSLELRVPLVDVRLREYLCAHNFEPARSKGKVSLVRQMVPELPEEIFTRAKSGFMFPIMQWLEPGELRKEHHWGADSRRLAVRILKGFIQSQS
ncbi:MAG: asparagine synthase (glutamine-hydrolyzing) [Chloroflexi bacterium]|nr:asparagine synthase (glutamine-hydrolyzing) [Chloroflexota bacterium]